MHRSDVWLRGCDHRALSLPSHSLLWPCHGPVSKAAYHALGLAGLGHVVEAGLSAGLLSRGHRGRTVGHDVGRLGRCHGHRRVVNVAPVSPLDPTTTSQSSMAPLFVASESMTPVAVARVMPLCLACPR